MNKPVVAELGGKRVLLLDSITWLASEDAGQIVVTGSHGGRSAGDCATNVALALCCFNDAGVGKERAGIVALDMLQQRGSPGLAYSHDSARVGDALDAWRNGVISHVNPSAATLGFSIGESLQPALRRTFDSSSVAALVTSSVTTSVSTIGGAGALK